ncbi:MAG: VanZ family protein [Mobilitalea sp.]
MVKIILSDIMNAVWLYGWYALIFAALIIVLILIIAIIYHKNDNKSFKDILGQSRYTLTLCYVFFAYLFLVISITLLCRPSGSRMGIDLVLFSTFSSNFLESRYPIENILLFIPYGLLVPNLWTPLRKIYLCIGTGFVFSISIEVIQLITKRGYFQLDDIFTNVAGVIMGFAVNYIFIAADPLKKKLVK